jgi:hypothetical protein
MPRQCEHFQTMPFPSTTVPFVQYGQGCNTVTDLNAVSVLIELYEH